MAFQPASLIRRLADARAEFVVVGGVAVAAHGVIYNTADLDVCVEPSAENRERVAEALAPLEPYPRGWPPGLPFVWDGRTLRDTPLLTLTTTAGSLDFVPELFGVGGYAEARRQSDRLDVEGRAVRVLSLDALIDVKRAVGRPKDLLVLPALEAARAERRGPA